MTHSDTGGRCMGDHDYGDSKGQSCIRCTCHKWIRPHDWEAHLEEAKPRAPDRYLSTTTMTKEEVRRRFERRPVEDE